LKNYKLTVLFFAILLSSLAAEQVLESIVARVGEQVILRSELNAYVQMRMEEQQEMYPLPQAKLQQYLQELIDGKILIAGAQLDTNLMVTPTEVENAVDNQIRTMRERSGLSPEEFEQVLIEQEGLSVPTLRKRMHESYKEQIIKQKIQMRESASLNLSREDITNFFATYEDKFPTIGPSYHLSQIEVKISTPDSIREAAYQQMKQIQQRLNDGADFAELAKKYSDGPNAQNGGDFGFVGRGTLGNVTFENVAFQLSSGQISPIFETKLGFHILKAKEFKAGKVHLEHILKSVAADSLVIAKAMQKLDSLKNTIQTREQFQQAAVKFNDNERLKANQGEIGWVAKEGIPQRIVSQFDELQQGAISDPYIKEDYAVITRINAFDPDRSLSLKDDWNIIAQKAKEIHATQRLQQLVDQWRKDVYIETHLSL